MIYLDNAATTYPKPEVVYTEMDRVNRALSVNAGRGSYKVAKEATAIIDDTRRLVSGLFSADGKAYVVFTSSVTQALNQIVSGLTLAENSVVYVSPYEHNAVARPLHLAERRTGCKIRTLPLHEDLSIDIEKMEFLFASEPPDAVFVTAVSNVTGYRLQYEKIFDVAHKWHCLTVLDASQAAGLVPISFIESNADIICFAGHKTLYGPFGIGGFLIGKNIKLDVSFAGGTGSNSLNLNMPEEAPGRYEASSQNITAIAGLRASLNELDQKEHYAKVKELTDYTVEQLSSIAGVLVHGQSTHTENIGIVSFNVDGYNSGEVGSILDEEYDIAVRTGYHCAPYIHDFLGDIEYAGTIRIGLGMFTTKEEIDTLIEAIRSLI